MTTSTIQPLQGLPQNDIQEALSEAYVRAAATHAGFLCDRPQKDYGVDLVIKRVTGHTITESEPRQYIDDEFLKLQLKSTTEWKLDKSEEHILWRCKPKAYNKLILPRRTIPLILVVYCLPPERPTWFTTTADEGTLRKCAYWWMPKKDAVPTTSSVLLEIPLTQQFDAATISWMSDRFFAGTWPTP